METLKIYKYSLLILISAIGFGIFLVSTSTFATSRDDIVYPVTELGGCKNEPSCMAYCEKPANIKPCVAFAEKHNLFPKEELARAKKFAEVGSGPGGCTSQASCESYCNDVNNINECVSYAEKHGIISDQELAEARKVQSALQKGVKLPGGCKNKKDCENYCQNPDKMEECISFAEAAGFMPPDELEEAKKALAAVKKGFKPPPCRGRNACDAYCSEPQNFEQCISFAEAAGFMSPEEAAMVKKTGGKGPGGCKGKRECDSFCQDENNLPACIEFAVQNGMMKPEEAEMVKKTGGKGPGGCKGREQCESFCQDTANQETCFNFGKEHGLISEEDLRRMEEGKQKIQEALSGAPPGVNECLDASLGGGFAEKIKSGAVPPSREFGDKIRECFEKSFMEGGGQGFPGGPGDPGGQFHGGPDGSGSFPGGPGEFPGQGATGGDFPGGPGEFPGGSREFPGSPGGTRPDFGVGQEGSQPPNPETIRQQIQQQTQQRIQQQIEQQFRQQFQQQTGQQIQQQIQQQTQEQIQRQMQQIPQSFQQFQPQSGTGPSGAQQQFGPSQFAPAPGSIPPPGSFTQPQPGGSFSPAPIQQAPAPGQSPPPPSSLRPPGLGEFLLRIFAGILFSSR